MPAVSCVRMNGIPAALNSPCLLFGITRSGALSTPLIGFTGPVGFVKSTRAQPVAFSSTQRAL